MTGNGGTGFGGLVGNYDDDRIQIAGELISCEERYLKNNILRNLFLLWLHGDVKPENYTKLFWKDIETFSGRDILGFFIFFCFKIYENKTALMKGLAMSATDFIDASKHRLPDQQLQ